MFCSKCGAQNADGSMFCIQCGNPLQNNQQTSAQPAPVQQTPAQQTGYYANSGATPPQPGYYAPGTAAMNQTPVMTAQTMVSPVKKPNYTLIGIISVAAVAIVVVVVVLLLLGGKSSIVGTWTLTDYGYDMSITFKANGTVETDSFVEAARYQTKGSTLIIIDEDGYAEKGEFKISKSGGKTFLKITFDGETLTFVKK